MSRFIPSSKSLPCPICSDVKGRCRSKYDEGKQFILCMSSNASKGEVTNKFKCVNPNGKDAWGSTWVESTEDENYSPELAQKRQAQTQKEERRHKAFLRSGLSRSERDKNIRLLSCHCGLSKIHRQKLKDRGLSDEAIASGYFFSVTPSQFAPKGIDPKTPGVGFGNKLSAGQSSLACPAFDCEGNVIGYQLRLDEATENKYRWAKGQRSSHLKNGELPITVARPVSGKPIGIGMAEGILKPLIASQIHNKIFLGASGANFASGLEQVRLYLEAISKELQTNVVDFFPDAGAVGNTHVIRSYRKTFDLLESLGYGVRVAWWGQSKKLDKDCDEIGSNEAIAYLSVSEFEEICIQHGGYISSTKAAEIELTDEELETQRKEEFYQRVVAAQRPLRSLTYKPDIIFTPEDGRYLPNLAEKVPETGILLLRAPKGAGKSVAIKKLKDYLCHAQIESDEVIEKTPIIEFVEKLTKRFASTTPRIALGREQARRWAYTWGGNISANDESIIDGTQANQFISIDDIGTTYDSFWKLSGRDFTNTLWVLDECELGLSHLGLSSTLKDKRPLVLRLIGEKIKECLENKGLLVLSDADLTDISVDYIRSLCPNAPIFFVDYQGNPEPWNVEFYTGKKNDVCQQIVDWFDPEISPETYQEPIHVFADSKEEAQALEQILLKKYPELNNRIGGIIRIDSSVTQTDFGQKFVEYPNQSIEKLKPRCLISTQSLGVGVSIDIPWFKHVFGLAFGTSEPSQIRQGLARVRQNVPRTIWAADKGKIEHGLRGSFFPEEIKNNLFSHHESTSELIGIAHELTKQSIQNQCDAEFLPAFIKTLESMMGITKSWNNGHLDLMAKFQARRNYSLSQFALQLRQELIDEGNNLIDFGSVDNNELGNEIKEQKQENKLIKAQKIAEAPDIDDDEAQKILKSPSATEEKLQSATKAMLRKELPGVSLTPEFVHRASVSDRGRWKNAVRLYWSCQNLDATMQRDLSTWRYKLKQFSEGAVYIPDINTLSLQCKTLIRSGIFEFVSQQQISGQELIDESPEIRGFLDWAENHKKLLQRAFGIKPDKSAVRFVNRLLGKIGLGLKVIRTQKLPDGNKLRWYELDKDKLSDPDRLVILEALDRRWQMQQEEKISREQAWIEQQAVAAQESISYNLESQSEGSKVGVTSISVYNNIGGSDTACEPCSKGISSNIASIEQQVVATQRTPNLESQSEGSKVGVTSISVYNNTGGSDTACEPCGEGILSNIASIKNQVVVTQKTSNLESQGDREVLEAVAVQKSELEKLVEALPFAETVEDFASIVEDTPLETVEDAIAFQPTQPRRKQLDEWLKEFVKGSQQTDVQAVNENSEPPLMPTNVESLTKGNEPLPAPPDVEESTLKVGDRVSVPRLPHTSGFAPFLIEAIEGAFAQVEMFEKLIPLNDLEVVG